MKFFRKFSRIFALLLVLVATKLLLARGQYSQYHHVPTKSNAYYEQQQMLGEPGEEPEVDDRPKVRVGFRLRIPAMKFDLPQVNLPKITVSAKIQQPNRVRTIRLPEINLDTSSHVSSSSAVEPVESDAPIPPSPVNNYRQYRRSNYTNNNYYSMAPSLNTQTISLSTNDDQDGQKSVSVDNYQRYKPRVNSYYANQFPVREQPIAYSYTRIQNPDIGFDEPVNNYAYGAHARLMRSAQMQASMPSQIEYPIRPVVNNNNNNDKYRLPDRSLGIRKRFRNFIYG